ncbi:MAG: hypothetical protein M3N95_07835 [Actinomycetota bacterium]|nr:hypothetical protein [Actinomycetota bacterium]
MLHPVGSLPASVYWRRRFLLFGVVAALVLLSAWVLSPSGGPRPAAGAIATTGSSPSNAALSTPSPTPAPTTPGSTAANAHLPARSTSTSTATPAGTSTIKTTAASPACAASALQVAAVVAQPRYNVGDQPQLLLQVTNTGPTACVQDLADRRVELRVYNGESRVWGSHDCEIQPGTAERTLNPGQVVRVSIVWSGLSSQPQCAGTRQRVGAGTYTLYALLGGRTGTAAQFLIS